MRGMNELADKVRKERLRRGWSVRQAAAAGKISNTYWGGFEDYKSPLTELVAQAVARAYEWPENWATETVATSPSAESQRMDELEQVVRAQARVVQAFGVAARERLGEHDELVARLDELAAALARLQAR